MAAILIVLFVEILAAAHSEQPLVLEAGQSYCTGDVQSCARLARVRAELDTPEMKAAIEAAQAQAPKKP